MSTRPMTVGVEQGDEIVIRIPVRALSSVLDLVNYRVTDEKAFAGAIVKALAHEQEDGTTPVHELLDRCCADAIERGSDVVEKGTP